MKKLYGLLTITFLFCPSVYASSHSHSNDDSDHKHYSNQEIMEIAMSAAPENVSGKATIMAADGTILKEGSNGWVCMPGSPPNENVNPMCVDPAWQNWLQEYMKAVNGEAYEYNSESASFGVSYMLVGDIAVDNNEPFNQDKSCLLYTSPSPRDRG